MTGSRATPVLLALVGGVALAFLAGSFSAEAAHCGSEITATGVYGPLGSTGQNSYAQIGVFFVDAPAHCGLAGGYITLNGVAQNARIEDSGDGYYSVYFTPTSSFPDGTYSVSARVLEHDGHLGVTSGEFAYTFTVRRCGTGGLSLEATTPSGVARTSYPLIQAKFRDPDTACGLKEWTMYVDGDPVPASYSRVGNEYYLTYQPTAPLEDGAHSVSVTATEVCCQTGFRSSNSGSGAWTFEIETCGSAPLVAVGYGPSKATSTRRPVISASFQDTDKACGIGTAWMRLDGVLVPVSKTEVDGDYYVSHVPAEPLSPGSHDVEVYIEEACCGSTGTPNWARVKWTFAIYPVGGPSGSYSSGVLGMNYTTPGTFRVDEPVCAAGVCVDEQEEPIPGQLSVAWEVGPVSIDYVTDSEYEHEVDRVDLGPVSTCNDGFCNVPVPVHGTQAHATVRLYARANEHEADTGTLVLP